LARRRVRVSQANGTARCVYGFANGGVLCVLRPGPGSFTGTPSRSPL